MPTPAPTTPPEPTPSPSPSPTTDAMFPPVELFPKDAVIHNEQFISRSVRFNATVSRDRGIVLCLYDKAFALGLSLIKELRCLGNRELIQVYYCLPQDLSPQNRNILLDQDDLLEIIDVCSDLIHAKVFHAQSANDFQNWWVKPLAVHHTNLHELILLDADDILLHDPAELRENRLYQQNGTLFFFDRVVEQTWFLRQRLRDRGHAPLLQYMVTHFDYAAFNLTGPHPSQHLLSSMAYKDRTCHEQDSSMVVIDKRRPGKAMDVLWWLITKLRLRVGFSWGDKEAFWLAFELAQQPYAFSPWGVSVVSSSTNKDMERHPETLCGSIAQYVPNAPTEPARLLYVNGKALVDPLSHDIFDKNVKPNVLYNVNATHVVPRMPRTPRKLYSHLNGRLSSAFPSECLVGLGATPIPEHFQRLLFRRRLHYLAITSGMLAPLAQCEFQWG